MRRSVPSVLAVTLLALSALPAAAQTPVSTCGQTVADGVLVNDLDCSSSGQPAVTVLPDGELGLAGFTIRAGAGGGVFCEESCTVNGGGGAILGLGGTASPTEYASGVFTNSFVNGMHPRHLLVIRTMEISDFPGQAIVGGDLQLENLVLAPSFWNSSGINVHITATTSGTPISGRRIEVFDSEFSAELSGRRVYVTDTTITGGHSGGAIGRIIRLDGSTVTGNCTGLSDMCADIASRRRPSLRNSECGTSRNLHNSNGSKPYVTWGVCADD